MKYVQIILFYLSILGATGFSLIAPLFPPLCKEKGIQIKYVLILFLQFVLPKFLLQYIVLHIFKNLEQEDYI